jgi:ATP-dependent DNA ligase
VICNNGTRLDFDALMQRMHPAAKRIEKLSAEFPACFIAFDALALDDSDLRMQSFKIRRECLQTLEKLRTPFFQITPQTPDVKIARGWFKNARKFGLKGIVAKDERLRYESNKRTMLKIRNRQTLDCIAVGYAAGVLLLALPSRST